MKVFWKENVHDWWRIITDHGAEYGTLSVDGPVTTFANEHCSLNTTVTEEESGVFCRTDTETNTSDAPLNLNCLNVRFALDGGE